jgi:hypothetical protein
VFQFFGHGIAFFLLSCALSAQIPVDSRCEFRKELIGEYFKTENGKTRKQQHGLTIQYNATRKRLEYSWSRNLRKGGKRFFVDELPNRVNLSLQCYLSYAAWPVLYNYQILLPPDSPQFVYKIDVGSFCKDASRFYPKLTPREVLFVPLKDRMDPYSLGACSPDWFPEAHPARFAFTPGSGPSSSQWIAKKRRELFVSLPVQYVSWCLPTVVSCLAEGIAERTEGEEGDYVLEDWYGFMAFSKNYKYVWGLTIGPGLDTATAKPIEVMDHLIKDVAKARKERWFDQDADAQALQVVLSSIQEAVRQGKNRDVKSLIAQAMKQLDLMKARAKMEVYSLVGCNLGFISNKI